jgi:hypothetical protein
MNDVVIASFSTHTQAEEAVKTLAGASFPMTALSVVGKGYHVDEHVTGLYNVGDRVKFWGSRGAFWGGLWGLFFGGLLMTIPIVGHVIVLGYLGAAAISAVEGAVVVGGVSALGAALCSVGVPKDSVLKYETAIKTDQFLVMVHGTPDETSRARDILSAMHPQILDLHTQTPAAPGVGRMIEAAV